MDNYNLDLVNYVLNLASKNNDPMFKEFVKQFYGFFYSSDIGLSGDFLFYIAKDIYNFINKRDADEEKVRIFDVNFTTSIGDVLTIVEMVNDNLPFIVDSTIEAIRKHVSIYHYTNAVLNIERKFGVIDKILPLNDCIKDQTNESVVYFIVKNIDDKLKVILKDEIRSVLKSIRFCVNDWKLVLAHVDSILDRIKYINGPKESELTAFLKWLKKDNFIFLGYNDYEYSDSTNNLVLNQGSSLGLCAINDEVDEVLLPQDDNLLCIMRSNLISSVHRRSYMDCISVRLFDSSGSVIRVQSFYGLFSSIVSFQDAKDIPIIREKIKAIEKRSGFIKGGHNNKALVSILQRFSREELFYALESELFEISMGMLFLSVNPRVKLFIRKDSFGNFVNCTVFIPKQRASTELAKRIGDLFQKRISGKIVGHYYNMADDSDFVRLQFVFKTADLEYYDVLEQDIESSLIEMTRTWEDKLADLLNHKLNSLDHIFMQYIHVFPVSYQDSFDDKSAYYDIQKLHRVKLEHTNEVDLYLRDNSQNYQLKIYLPNNGNLQLSKVLNIVKKMGMDILGHSSYEINIDEGIWLHHFLLANCKNDFDYIKIKKQFEITLKKVFSKEIDNDFLNSLVMLANLDWREVLLIRSLVKYLKQISFNYSQIYIQKVLIKHCNIIRNIISLFKLRFDPSLTIDRESEIEAIKDCIEKKLFDITDIVHDHIISCLYNLILAILRTNYYQGKEYLSMKFDSSKVPSIPLPCPFREIYVYSHLFEAIHLRGGKVARGGIRWSDRTEDFRTEILGLMKAQMTKNSVIVPVGSKGGFILKKNIKDKFRRMEYTVKCYQDFLRGMLDITDNVIVSDNPVVGCAVVNVVTPENIVKYDDDDPYLVVAADKGTASFSDYANKVSEEYNFWLGDAFASGGSAGYDHKKMGITARGAWVAAQRHFWEMGKNIQIETFTVIGIGDMSGDVFGNGMLLSQHICLLGAFNHLHIFVDPSPNPTKSFAERKRLFEMPSSSWMDYDRSIISKGGGVFNRSAKFIEISSEMKCCFGISEDRLSPNEFVVYLLKAPVDMIWNGGIGTYVKSSKESNAVVSDKSNDNVRVNGSDLKALMVIEGGNLGCTQLGRVEYAANGGRINTDFIDNVGGVVCSDFEVNIKILLKLVVMTNSISLEDRNKILENMTDEIALMVLKRHNQLETNALMLECMQAKERLEQHNKLLEYLEKYASLDRAIEFLPSNEEVVHMYSESRAFTSPQLAVLMSYSRMFLKKEILSSDIINKSGKLMDLYCNSYLLAYFPKYIQDNFHGYINSHHLKNEIFSTCVANDVINRMGCGFVSHIVENLGVSTDSVIKAYVLITHLYELRDLWNAIDDLDGKVNISLYKEIIRELQQFIGQTIFWCFRNPTVLKGIEEGYDNFSNKVKVLENSISNIIDDTFMEKYNSMLNNLSQSGLGSFIVHKIVGLKFLTFALDIISVADITNLPIVIVGKIYFKIRTLLNFSRIRDIALQIEAGSSYWQRISVRGLADDLNDYHCLLSKKILKEVGSIRDRIFCAVENNVLLDNIVTEIIDMWCDKYRIPLESYRNFFSDINKTQIDISKLVIIIRRLRVFIDD